MPDEQISTLLGSPSPPIADDYCNLATRIREVARDTRLPVARRELIRLTAGDDRRAEHLDNRTFYWCPRLEPLSQIIRVEAALEAQPYLNLNQPVPPAIADSNNGGANVLVDRQIDASVLSDM